MSIYLHVPINDEKTEDNIVVYVIKIQKVYLIAELIEFFFTL